MSESAVKSELKGRTAVAITKEQPLNHKACGASEISAAEDQMAGAAPTQGHTDALTLEGSATMLVFP